MDSAVFDIMHVEQGHISLFLGMYKTGFLTVHLYALAN